MTERPVVVFLHGLARGAGSFRSLRRAVEDAGFETWARTYASRKKSLHALSVEVAERLEAEHPGRRLFAVTHSMGGIVLRLLAHRFSWAGSALIAPPNRGSVVAHKLRGRRWFRSVLGPSALELGDPEAAETWPPPPPPCAVIVGNVGVRWDNPVSWHNGTFLKDHGPHDGTVAHTESRLDAGEEWYEVPRSHTWILRAPETQEIVLKLLCRRS